MCELVKRSDPNRHCLCVEPSSVWDSHPVFSFDFVTNLVRGASWPPAEKGAGSSPRPREEVAEVAPCRACLLSASWSPSTVPWGLGHVGCEHRKPLAGGRGTIGGGVGTGESISPTILSPELGIDGLGFLCLSR